MYLRALSIFGIIVCGVMAALFVAATASAADWPTRPVKFIVTLGPGSGTDIGARVLADRLTQR
jgi:tripartite-type tricarboxylate transporter receptor subunit TctC